MSVHFRYRLWLVLLGLVACELPLESGYFGGPAPVDWYWLDGWRVQLSPPTVEIPVGGTYTINARVIQSHSGIPINQHRWTWTWTIEDRRVCQGQMWSWDGQTKGFEEVGNASSITLTGVARGTTRVRAKIKFGSAEAWVTVK